jgi:hypothetical protein
MELPTDSTLVMKESSLRQRVIDVKEPGDGLVINRPKESRGRHILIKYLNNAEEIQNE